MFETFYPTRAERLAMASVLPGHIGMLLAGTARSLRFSHDVQRPEEETVRRVSADVHAPLIFLFVAWVLDEARKRKLERLYFLARDGQVMYKVAKVLARYWTPEIQLRYLYCSRESLSHISDEGVEDFDLQWLTKGHMGAISLAEICARLRCSKQDFADILTKHHCSVNDISNRLLGTAEIEEVKGILRQSTATELLIQQGAEKRTLACRYLVQEGFLNFPKIGVVDTGWNGSSQFALHKLLRSAANDAGVSVPNLHGFYLGVSQGATVTEDSQKDGFLFDEPKGVKAPRNINFPCIEMLCGARHGRVIGYVSKQGRLYPQMVSEENNRYDLVRIQQALAVSFAHRLAPLLKLEDMPGLSAAKLCNRLVQGLVATPDADIAKVYGRWPMGFEIRERDLGEMAPPLSMASLAACVFGRKKYIGFWPQASFVRGGLGFLCPAYNLFQSIGGVEALRHTIVTRR